jgi:hypothetical protein
MSYSKTNFALYHAKASRSKMANDLHLRPALISLYPTALVSTPVPQKSFHLWRNHHIFCCASIS